MLYALSIQSFVLIDRLDLDAATGFTALTGETGAGKSIILDALSLVLGGEPDRTQIRAGAEQASISAEFFVPETHPVWNILTDRGIDYSPDEALMLRRTVPLNGPSRAFINGQPVAAAMLAALAESLVEIHGQHAASQLMRPSAHLGLLDEFAGLDSERAACGQLWRDVETARAAHDALETDVRSAREKADWLAFAVAELVKLAPEGGEVETLTAQRAALLQSERMTGAIEEAAEALSEPRLEEALSVASRAVERILRIPGLDSLDGKILTLSEAAAAAIERALIELGEARQGADSLARYTGHDGDRLEQVEARLFALRAAGRKYDCLPELLPDILDAYQRDLELCDANSEALDQARRDEQAAHAAWRAQAEKLSAARRTAASGLEAAVMAEMAPLHLGRVTMRVRFADIEADASGAKGLERAEFEVETNTGAGFGPLRTIASGGELARVSLALKCALSQSGSATCLIFDEADQGVGGAVAAAIGERLARLSEARQVFAITHSPQVASAATRQWRVLKETNASGETVSQVAQLDDGQRLEEIARMLSGSSITNEARAAALKLLEAA